jgi:hypothetical protein
MHANGRRQAVRTGENGKGQIRQLYQPAEQQNSYSCDQISPFSRPVIVLSVPAPHITVMGELWLARELPLKRESTEILVRSGTQGVPPTQVSFKFCAKLTFAQSVLMCDCGTSQI